MTNTKLLVTGGSGFIGTNLITYCLKHGIDVINVDWNPPLDVSHKPHWINCDILDQDALQKVFSDYQPTHVVHLAARADTDEQQDMAAYLQNTEGTRHVLECVKNTPSIERLIVTSTQFVCQPGYYPQHDEDYNPVNLYGMTKILTEQFTRHASLSCSWTIIRPTTIWGPWSLRYRDVFFKTLKSGLYFHPSKENVIRSYGYVNNVVFQIMQILTLEEEKVNGKVFYVGDEPFELKEWVNTVSQVLTGKKVNIIPTGLVKTMASIGDILTAFKIRFPITSGRFRSMTSSYVTPMDDTINVLGKAPYSIQQGVEETINWYKTISAQVSKPEPDIPRKRYFYTAPTYQMQQA
ncbi:NAD(P)-dependent oxidoreductase [Cytophagaceae bacterium YF14B1]|uniref:NAD(P)-dependent oxidoreductase n=1 Tax=Xanthocytophaga flava TaxID=3048013 RepID=A0AAE3QT65_9BACT|nr:NAD(P)-dependent oxidoreductase [Xanthocytophaga flavus]MDJ1484987.1 NAD(P)-dependent oxidoreductase [Xanthocytophaga flavus]